MSKSCDFVHAKGGFRLHSGQAVVSIVIDGQLRELKVMRNGKGKSNLERGFITLKDLAAHVPEGDLVKVTVEHLGVKIPLQIDPRNAMGREGRAGVSELQETIEYLDVAQRYALGMLQIETLPDSTRNVGPARERLKFALKTTTDELLQDEELATLSAILDEETTQVLMRRHPATVSRLAYGLSVHGLKPEMLAAVSREAKEALVKEGFLDNNGNIPLLERFNLSSAELAELAHRNAVLHKEHGALVGAVPVAVWQKAREGVLPRVSSLAGASVTTRAESFKNAAGAEFVLDGVTHQIADRSVVFGAPSDSTWPNGVEVLPRNPYVIAGLPVTSKEGRDVALAYTAAIAAISEASYEPGCWRCKSQPSRCAACVVDPLEELRSAARTLVGDLPKLDSYSYTHDNTVVDALLFASVNGDEAAKEAFDTLSYLGETMVTSIKAKGGLQILDDETFDAAAKSGRMGPTWETSNRLQQVWLEKTASRFDELVRVGDLTQEQADSFRIEIMSQGSSDLKDKISQRVGSEINSAAEQQSEHLAHFEFEDVFWVREIDHLPEIDQDGNAVMRPAGDFIDTKRGSLHGALNGRAMGHMFRSGESASHVMVARLSDIVAANPDAIDMLYTVDSYFTPPPGEGLTIPAGTFQLHEYSDSSPAPVADPGNVTPEENAASRAFAEGRDAFVTSVLLGMGATRTFAQSTHNSSHGADGLARRLADRLGAASTLHSNTFVSRSEGLGHLDAISDSGASFLGVTATELATMSRNSRLRMVAHNDWAGVRASQPKVEDPNSIW
jgi:hypothetical protein